MKEILHIGDRAYHIQYDYLPEEKSNEHFAPAKIELEYVFDDQGEHPDDKLLLEEIESKLLNLHS